MHRAPRFLVALALTLCGALAVATPVHAQRALQQVLDLNRQAMEAYTNLEVEQAMTLLNQAREVAQRGRVTGAPLARTLMNLGVVSIGGMGDNGRGLDYFVQALRADPNVQLDPLTSTPDIQTTFALARARAGAGGGAQIETPPDTSGGGTGAAPGNLTHQPIPEQLTQTAVPVFVEVPGRPAHVYLYYRGHGMREFSRVEMQRMAGGYGYEIPCTDVFEPEVSYYIVVFGSDGSPLGFSGSQSAPITVPIVSSRTQPAPALPGRAPPDQCVEAECPPGMEHCQRGGGGGGGLPGDGERQLGESCMSDQQCASGNCEDDLCADGGGGGGAPGTGMAAAPRFFIRVGGGMGLSYVSPGIRADRVPCNFDDLECEARARANGREIEYFEDNDFPTSGLGGWHAQGYEAASESNQSASPCAADPDGAGPMTGDPGCMNNSPGSLDGNRGDFEQTPCGVGFDEDGNALDACLYIRDAGLVPNFQLRLEAGYYVLPMLGFSLFTRIQPISGRGTLAPALIGARVHLRVLDEGGDSGPSIALHVGGQVGQIQVSVPNNGPRAPWGQSGLGGIHFGASISYRFIRNVGLFVEPDFIFQFPNFLFTIDLHGGLEIGF